ncbi:MAG: hypothetical protein IJT52_02385 [Spirochaetales bacterium]|nr:hypothetical protein [Spirochaetales bacterium]
MHIDFRSCGASFAAIDWDGTTQFSMPEDPQRKGFRFNGWWVTTEEGVLPFSCQWLSKQDGCADIKVNARWLNVSYNLEVQDFDTDGYVQDGAIYADYFFKFHSDGACVVHSMVSHKELGKFVLDKADIFKPHCNATCFTNHFYEADDEFPLLYANIYNSYGKEGDRRLGNFGVYRIFRTEKGFSSQLVQIIRIGFTAENGLWHSDDGVDRSPFGNFILDTDRQQIWAFVTRDKTRTTRFFCFEMPDPEEGEPSDTYGVNVFTLEKKAILRYFDVPYSWYLQGACYCGGKIYSTEGLGTEDNPSCIRVVDLENEAEDYVADLQKDGWPKEAEFIDIWNGDFWYGSYMKADSPRAPVFRVTGL